MDKKGNISIVVLYVLYIGLIVIYYIITGDLKALLPETYSDSVFIGYPLITVWDMLPIWYALAIGFTIWKQERLKISNVLYWLVFLIMLFRSIKAIPYFRYICIGIQIIGFLLWIQSMSEYRIMEVWKASRKFLQRNKNGWKITGILLIFIILNVVYIVYPKTYYYMYTEVVNFDGLRYEVDAPLIETKTSLDLANIDIYMDLRGWVVHAVSSGTVTVQIIDIPPNESDGENLLEQRTIMIDEHLRFRNVLTFDYIRHIYRKNVLAIVLGVVILLFIFIHMRLPADEEEIIPFDKAGLE